MRRALLLTAACLLSSGAAVGCSGSDSAVISVPPGQKAHTYHVAGFTPTAPVAPGKPTTVSFTIIQPSGKPLTRYATGAGPHVGVHLIFVRTDLSAIVHLHPPIGPDGKITQQVTFPASGPWQLIIDAYLPGSQTTLVNRNFQLYQDIDVTGPHRAKPLGRVRTSLTAGGYTFTIKHLPALHVAQAQFMDVAVRGPSGQIPTFTPWFGALAHAIFFQRARPQLHYYHTHICSPALALCTVKGAISGSSPTHGDLRVGMLFPTAGRWRLFLQCQIDGKVITAPFTLDVRP
jgi:hypothetical protein